LKITVKYSLPFREEVGLKEEIFEIAPDSAAVAEVLEQIIQRHSSMRKFVNTSSDETQRRHLVVAINSRLSKLSDSVHDGDKVSLLLPVIGG
jgi:molybdopterin converting factor small subunit